MKTIIIILLIIAFSFLVACSKEIASPFGPNPIGVAPNCGPEMRDRLNALILSKEEFINFLQTNKDTIVDKYGNNLLRLDNFKKIEPSMNISEIESLPIEWGSVRDYVQTEVLKTYIADGAILRQVYVLNYKPYGCGNYTLKMTSDGFISVYGCCGK